MCDVMGYGKTSSYCKQERIDAGLSRGMQVMVRFKVMECCRISRNFMCVCFAFLCDNLMK